MNCRVELTGEWAEGEMNCNRLDELLLEFVAKIWGLIPFC